MVMVITFRIKIWQLFAAVSMCRVAVDYVCMAAKAKTALLLAGFCDKPVQEIIKSCGVGQNMCEEVSVVCDDARDEMRRVRLARAMHLLECSDGELRELLARQEPELGSVELNSLHREEMVARLLQ